MFLLGFFMARCGLAQERTVKPQLDYIVEGLVARVYVKIPCRITFNSN